VGAGASGGLPGPPVHGGGRLSRAVPHHPPSVMRLPCLAAPLAAS